MFDVLIIGAGPSGLAAAKTILECDNARINLRVVDSNKTIGGVWAAEKLYPGLRTNNLKGTIDFTDLPMDDSFGVKTGTPVPGEVMHEYFKQYAQRKDILRRIDFDTQVLEVSRLGSTEGWTVKVRRPSGEQEMQTKKLIVATGVTNDPHKPYIEGADQFQAPIIHSADCGIKSGPIVKDPGIETVAVLGGGKSAWDAVYLAAMAGKKVEWIIRKSGRGSAYVFPPDAHVGPFIARRELLPVRRFVSCFSPCIWEDGMGWLRKFLHSTSFGLKITRKFWANMHTKTIGQCLFRTEPSLGILEPDQSPFWYGTHSGVYTYKNPDFYDFIRSGHVRIHREDITHLSPHTIHFASSSITAHALITATGFSPKPTINFAPPSLHSDLGLPTTSLTAEQRTLWTDLDEKADRTIAATYPRLVTGPYTSPSSETIQPFDAGDNPSLNYSPFRLYRGIAPPGLTTSHDRSLVFIGMISNISATIRLELQCLWAYAYLNDRLAIKEDTIFEDTALMSRYAKHRAPYGHGRFFPDLVFDQVPYFDMLMRDLGLRTWRKKGWGKWCKELFGAYRQEEYRGVVGEWLSKEGLGVGGGLAAKGMEERQPLLGNTD